MTHKRHGFRARPGIALHMLLDKPVQHRCYHACPQHLQYIQDILNLAKVAVSTARRTASTISLAKYLLRAFAVGCLSWCKVGNLTWMTSTHLRPVSAWLNAPSVKKQEVHNRFTTMLSGLEASTGMLPATSFQAGAAAIMLKNLTGVRSSPISNQKC